MFLKSQMGKIKGGTLNMYIIVGMSRITKPHKFFSGLDFILHSMPGGFKKWSSHDLDMAYLP